MAENKIELKSINELLGMKFFIPLYQRGYRWTEQQVKDLLNDIWEFSKKKKQDRGTEGRNLTLKTQMLDIDGTYEVLFYGPSLNHCIKQAEAWADKYNCVLKAMSISQR